MASSVTSVSNLAVILISCGHAFARRVCRPAASSRAHPADAFGRAWRRAASRGSCRRGALVQLAGSRGHVSFDDDAHERPAVDRQHARLANGGRRRGAGSIRTPISRARRRPRSNRYDPPAPDRLTMRIVPRRRSDDRPDRLRGTRPRHRRLAGRRRRAAPEARRQRIRDRPVRRAPADGAACVARRHASEWPVHGPGRASTIVRMRARFEPPAMEHGADDDRRDRLEDAAGDAGVMPHPERVVDDRCVLAVLPRSARRRSARARKNCKEVRQRDRREGGHRPRSGSRRVERLADRALQHGGDRQHAERLQDRGAHACMLEISSSVISSSARPDRSRAARASTSGRETSW